jgi:hypothetical protein
MQNLWCFSVVMLNHIPTSGHVGTLVAPFTISHVAWTISKSVVDAFKPILLIPRLA